jgi:putative ABC transport system substrate-binding protein
VKFGHQHVRDVPIIAGDLESDPVKEGYAQSYARPGGNITGLFMDFPDLAAKWLQLVKECAPDINRVVILWDPVTGAGQVEALMAAAAQLQIAVTVAEVAHPLQSVKVLTSLAPMTRTGVIQLGTPAGSSPDRPLTQALIDLKLPSMFHLKRYVVAGGLMSYGPKLEIYFPRAVDIAAKVLAGTPPGDIPIEKPDRFDFVVNTRTAKTLGLTIPASILLRADEVIE